MPNPQEPKPFDDVDTLGLINAAIIGLVLFTLLSKLMRRPILLTIVVAALFGFYWYGQQLLQSGLHQVKIRRLAPATTAAT